MRAAAAAALPDRSRRHLLHLTGRFAPWEHGYRLQAPVLGNAPGAAPDFVGIGAQKCGTTWWYSLIVAHPGVFEAPGLHKERHVLSRYGQVTFGADDVAAYHRWFPRPPGQLCGEWTPDYLQLPWVPELLYRAAPEARILVLLRDPVERFASGLAHARPGQGDVVHGATADAAVRGYYHHALQGWLRYFPPEQLLLLQYERCVAEPQGQLARTYAFLGLAPFLPDGIDQPVSATTDPVRLPDQVRRRMVTAYREDVEALFGQFQTLERHWWPNFGPEDVS